MQIFDPTAAAACQPANSLFWGLAAGDRIDRLAFHVPCASCRSFLPPPCTDEGQDGGLGVSREVRPRHENHLQPLVAQVRR